MITVTPQVDMTGYCSQYSTYSQSLDHFIHLFISQFLTLSILVCLYIPLFSCHISLSSYIQQPISCKWSKVILSKFSPPHIFYITARSCNIFVSFLAGNGPCPRSACQMVSLSDGRILIYGGYSKEKVKKDVEKGITHTDMYILAPDSKLQIRNLVRLFSCIIDTKNNASTSICIVIVGIGFKRNSTWK